MDVSYDGDRYEPLSDFDASRGAVALGLQATGKGGLRVVSRNQLRQTASVTFSPRVDLDVDLALGASDADVELGGLRVVGWTIQTGASQAVIRFSQPNGTRCRSGSVSAGAANLTVLGLGNSRCDRLDFEGGIGKVTLDFGGTWTVSSEVGVKMAVGELVLRLPRQAGVRISLDEFLASFKPAGSGAAGNDLPVCRVRRSGAQAGDRRDDGSRGGTGGVDGLNRVSGDPSPFTFHAFTFPPCPPSRPSASPSAHPSPPG